MAQPVPILMYHSVSNEATPRFRRWTIDSDLFAEHMAHLAAEGYRALTVTDFFTRAYDGRALENKSVVLTFDDGYADFRTTALPILRRHGLAATLYVTTGFVGGTSEWLVAEGEADRPMLGWDDIEAIAGDGVEIGAHAVTHPHLDTLPLQKALVEIAASKKAIEDRLGSPITTFAYPFGHSSPAVRRAVQSMGFLAACGVKHALSSTDDDRYALARVEVRGGTDLAILDRYLRGDGLRVAPPTATLPRWGWRQVRRAKEMVHKFRAAA